MILSHPQSQKPMSLSHYYILSGDWRITK